MADDPMTLAGQPAVIAHVGYLQDAIKRMADNSASAKGWCLTLVSALIGLASLAHAKEVTAVILVPLVVFGFLDAMYLAQEKAFRVLYDTIVCKIRTGAYGADDLFNMRAGITRKKFAEALSSWAVFPVYFGLALAYLVALEGGWLDSLTASGR